MAKKVLTQIKLQAVGGQASPAPPVGPALGQHGVNIMEFVKSFNAQTQADAEVSAANVYAKAYRADPGLYTTLRSLDAAGKIVGPNTSVILRTDAAPFKVLSQGPGGGKK